MPVRALRPITYLTLNRQLGLGQNPINARKGITTYTAYTYAAPSVGQNPINARKGITTHADCEQDDHFVKSESY